MAKMQLSHSATWLVSVAIVAAIALNWVFAIDELAQDYLTDTISSNAIVFGVVRTFNGVISVVQSAEVGVGVAGIGIGEIFDPVNDLIERFSGLLLVTLTALGIQQVILLFTTSMPLKVLFTVVSLVSLAMVWWQKGSVSLVLRILVVLLFLRFLLTLQVGFVWLFDWVYFDATGEEALSVLEATTQVVQNIRQTVTEIDLSSLLFGRDADLIEKEDISSRIAASVVTLIVGMLFKSILIPIGTLWLGYKVSRVVVAGERG